MLVGRSNAAGVVFAGADLIERYASRWYKFVDAVSSPTAHLAVGHLLSTGMEGTDAQTLELDIGGCVGDLAVVVAAPAA